MIGPELGVYMRDVKYIIIVYLQFTSSVFIIWPTLNFRRCTVDDVPASAVFLKSYPELFVPMEVSKSGTLMTNNPPLRLITSGNPPALLSRGRISTFHQFLLRILGVRPARDVNIS